LLLSILANNGLAAYEADGYVNIIPDAGIRQFPMRIVQRDDSSIPDAEWVSRVIEVPGGNAHQLVPILRPLLPQAGHLAAAPVSSGASGEPPFRELLIVAPYGKVRHVTELVKLLAP